MDKLSELVPEFYFDLIARVTPGAVFCAALAWTVRQQVPLAELDPVIALPLGLLASYLAGFLLESVSSITLGWLAWRVADELGKSRPASVWAVDVWGTLDKEGSERLRPKVVKMLAERTMVRTLVMLVAVMWVFEMTPVAGFSVLQRFALLLVLATCWAKREHSVRLAIRPPA